MRIFYCGLRAIFMHARLASIVSRIRLSLNGIVPIVFVPFDVDGRMDESGLRRVVRFELDGGAGGIGINGCASKAYKLGNQERLHTAHIVAEVNAGQAPLLIGLSAGSTEVVLAHVFRMKR